MFAYSRQSLRYRLSSQYGDRITFISSTNKTTSDLVCSADVSIHDLVDDELINVAGLTTNSETCSDSNSLDGIGMLSSMSHSTEFYHTAMKIKYDMQKVEAPRMSWPPTAAEFDLKLCDETVCSGLFNMIALVTGASDSVPRDGTKLLVSDDSVKLRILSICQDIISLQSKGRSTTPKSLALGMALRHMTGSKQIAQLISGLGHAVSYESVLRLETALATKQLEDTNVGKIPEGFTKASLTTLVYDNIDFAEETLSGAGTTHFTNGIMFQLQQDPTTSNQSGNCSTISNREKAFKDSAEDIVPFFLTKKVGPQVCTAECADELRNAEELCQSLSNKEFTYIACKNALGDSLPSWTGFNIMTSHQLPESAIAYLPVIKASPTELSTVKCILVKAIEAADNLNVQNVFVVFDQAIYAKAQQIRWLDPVFSSRLVIRMGEFHTIMAFLGMLGKRYTMSGFEDILVESGVLASGSTKGVLSGHMYNRSVRCHKLLYESLARLQLVDFLDNWDHPDKDQLIASICSMGEMIPQQADVIPVHMEASSRLQQHFDAYITQKCVDSPTYQFWNSYLDNVRLLLTFIRATREADWDLHLAALRLMLRWFFAYDRVNYARYSIIFVFKLLNMLQYKSEAF